MSTALQYVSWEVAGDSELVGFEDWHPDWIQAILTHLNCDTEEEVAGVYQTHLEEEIWETDNYFLTYDELPTSHKYTSWLTRHNLGSNDDRAFYEIEPVPANGLSIGMMQFGWIGVETKEHGYSIMPCVAVFNASPACLYVPAHSLVGLSRPLWDAT